jgi:hypothetical protein
MGERRWTEKMSGVSVNQIKLTKAQKAVVLELQKGAVIGELSDKRNGRYKLFMRKTNWFPITCHQFEHPFTVMRLNKNTVFALLTLGLIEKDRPFERDNWYVLIKTND